MSPALFLFGLGLGVAYWPGTLESAFVLRWVLIAAAPPALLLIYDMKVPAALRGVGAMMFLVAALSAAWAPSPMTAIEEVVHLCALAGVFCLGAAVQDVSSAWRGMALGIAVNAGTAIAQHSFGFDLIQQAVRPAGLFVNKNMLAEAGMVALVVMVCLRHWWLATAAAVCVLLGESRAVYGAVVVTIAAWLLRRDKMIALPLFGIAVAGAVAVFHEGGGSAAVRLGFWGDALSDLRWMGHGIGAYTAAFPFAEYAHNELLQMIYELGPLWSLMAVLMLFYLWMEPTHETERLVLVAIAAVGAFSFPLHMPFTAAAFALAAGRVAGARVCLQRPEHLAGGNVA